MEFKKYADWYRKKYKIAPVLVIDNINILATDTPEVLKILQRGAKNAVDSCLFTTVFVSSDGAAPNQMFGISIFLCQETILPQEHKSTALVI